MCMLVVAGALAESYVSACSSRKLSSGRIQLRTLVDSNAPLVTCPVSGRFPIQLSQADCPVYMEIGCESLSSISIQQCNDISEYK